MGGGRYEKARASRISLLQPFVDIPLIYRCICKDDGLYLQRQKVRRELLFGHDHAALD